MRSQSGSGWDGRGCSMMDEVHGRDCRLVVGSMSGRALDSFHNLCKGLKCPAISRHSQLPLDSIGVSELAWQSGNLLTVQPRHGFLLAQYEAGWLILNNILRLEMASFDRLTNCTFFTCIRALGNP